MVFIKELVPRSVIAFIARKFYNENYIALPMSHRIETIQKDIKSVSYSWRFKGREDFLSWRVQWQAQPLVEGSLQEFIAEHYWGYASQRDGTTMEYRVEHPRWRIWETQAEKLRFVAMWPICMARFFAKLLSIRHHPLFWYGSEVTVFSGVQL